MNMTLRQIFKDIRLECLDAVHKKEIINIELKNAEKRILKEYTSKPLYSRKIELKPLDKNNYNLSIIIPAYNCAKYVKKCLETLINQKTDYTYEIIIVNDGSKDNSEDVIKSVKSSKIKLVNQPNGGAAMARNTGLMNATGEYVCFFDADDYAELNYVDRLLGEAYKHNADIVKCGFYTYQANEPNSIGVKTVKKAAVIEGDMTKYIGEYDGFIWNMIEKRSLWSDFAFPEKWWFEDMITEILVMRKSSKFVYIAEPLYHYAIIETSLSRSEWKSSDIRAIDQLWLVKRIIENIKEFGLENNAEQYNMIIHELGSMLYGRVLGLDIELKKAIFVVAAYITDLYRKNGWDNKLEKLQYRKLNKAFASRDFSLWEIASLKG